MLPIPPFIAEPMIKQWERERIQEADQARLARGALEPHDAAGTAGTTPLPLVVCTLLLASMLVILLLYESVRLLTQTTAISRPIYSVAAVRTAFAANPTLRVGRVVSVRGTY